MSGYSAVHMRLSATLGPARNHLCVAPGCTAQAAEWALLGAPTQAGLRGGAEVRWSDDLDAYAPTCIMHNRQLDAGGDWFYCKNGHDRAETGKDPNGDCSQCRRDRCNAYYRERVTR